MIAALQQRDEATMGQAGAAPGSATRQKWLHVIQVRAFRARNDKIQCCFSSTCNALTHGGLGIDATHHRTLPAPNPHLLF